jgi:hypothetical protein
MAIPSTGSIKIDRQGLLLAKIFLGAVDTMHHALVQWRYPESLAARCLSLEEALLLQSTLHTGTHFARHVLRSCLKQFNYPTKLFDAVHA